MFDYRQPFYRKILVLINVFIIFVYLIVCLVPFVDTGINWLVALPGLAFPLLFFALLFFIIIWIVLKSKWLWVSVVAMLLGFQQVAAVFSFHFNKEFTYDKEPNSLRIFHWNVERWGLDYEKNMDGEQSFKPYMLNIIQEEDPDILCFEEYSDLKNIRDTNSNVSQFIKMGYPYFLSIPTDTSFEKTTRGVAIFSKYPFIHTGIFSYGEYSKAEHLIYADINVGKDTFRIFTTHLQSVSFAETDFRSLSKLKRGRDPGYNNSKDIISKLKRAYWYRYIQAQTVKQKIAESPYPVIITGDFNDVPNSNTYFTIKGKLQDTFLKKGSFIGHTYRYISPTLRIDYIFAGKRFKVNQFRVIHVPYSDHYPIETDLQY
jgi:endonuclease/exonuclease/phosphatase family metal-dependent hydrolase